ncbi:MAG: NAD(P)H-dependent oxidoreductase [Thermomicrobiales bacterium]|nr:NAD(P)H-dependent oxidoreductase [Thermomicrobiales bacterium]MCO5217325.1 NAD(P)H-dependent oxidoreductase [Thermomicrobiales bacterium]MCO5226173.1 NAD(P)H-dependent oxidoreductase [Thermomicrobiales bacterium]MCO5228712.1 NAD(P)H-dependent oxidoreductase [Thermomicrobiales bacterium]
MKIGIVVGSIREERKGIKVGEWLLAQTRTRDDAEYVLIDLKSFDVPLLTSPTHPAQAKKQYESANVRRWSEAIDACDGFVFVTAEYNHGVPGAFKNAVDSVAPEWTNKPVSFVGYGSVDGSRAIEQWRQILANFSMFDIRAQVGLNGFTDFETDGTVKPNDRKSESAQTMLDQLVAEVRLRAS